MNPFEAGERKIVPAVLVYARFGNGADERILMIHRNASKTDYHLGKWNGLGGKLELDESPLEAARRELFEESGLDLPLEAFRAVGTLQFPNFKAHKSEDWWVTVFVAECGASANGEPPQTRPCGEGEQRWVRASEVAALNLWAGDKLFIPLVLERKPFVGTIWYEGDRVLRSWIQGLDSESSSQMPSSSRT